MLYIKLIYFIIIIEIIHLIYFSSGRPIKLVVFNKKFLKFFAKLPRPKYIPCVDIHIHKSKYYILFNNFNIYR